MKRPIIVLGIVLLVSFGAVAGFLVSKKVNKAKVVNELQLFETAYMVIHPGAKTGETIIFPAFSGTGVTTYVHFPLQSPCAAHVLSGTPEHPPQCDVTQVVHGTTLAQYPYTLSTKPDLEQGQGRCQSCCVGYRIVLPDPNHPTGSIPTGGGGSGPYPAAEVLIDDSLTGGIVVQNLAAYPGQPVQWFRSGTEDTEWSVAFEDPTACSDKKAIGSGVLRSQTCTVAGSAQKSPYKYTVNVGGKTTTGLLYINPPFPIDMSM